MPALLVVLKLVAFSAISDGRVQLSASLLTVPQIHIASSAR